MGRVGFTVAVWIMLAVTIPQPVVQAREVVVVRKGNRPISGTIVKQDDGGIMLDFGGAEVFIPAEQIERVEYNDSVEMQYQKRREEIGVNDLEKRYELAKWLQRESAFELALVEVNDLIRRRPGDGRFMQLRRAIVADKASRIRTSSRARGDRAKLKQATGSGGSNKKSRAFWLTEAQINVIKIWETDWKSLGPNTRVVVPRETMRTFIEKYSDHAGMPVGTTARRRLLGAKGYVKLRKIVDRDARELFGDVIMRDEPPAMRTYRRDIHRQYIVSYCAARNCHGRDDIGVLRLRREQASSERTAYTNFAILEQYENRDGFRLIDRHEVAASMLPAYGLSRTEAKASHPDVPGYKPYFRMRKDERYAAMVNWISQLKYPLPAKHYGIQYTPLKGASQAPAETKVTGRDEEE